MADSMPTLENECFFIAPIGDEGSDIRRRSDGVLNFIVARAAEELGLTAIRADQLSAPGQITLQVIDHILQARAAVADLTGWNANVFYELAVRHSARLPVALIVASEDPPLPFDIAQMRVIRFDHRDLESADRCRQAIVAHLREALDGAVDSPIGASIDLRALGGGDRVERSIAEVLTGIEELLRLQRMAVDRVDTAAVERVAAYIRELEVRREREYDFLHTIRTALGLVVEELDSADEAIRRNAVERLKATQASLDTLTRPTLSSYSSIVARLRPFGPEIDSPGMIAAIWAEEDLQRGRRRLTRAEEEAVMREAARRRRKLQTDPRHSQQEEDKKAPGETPSPPGPSNEDPE